MQICTRTSLSDIYQKLREGNLTQVESDLETLLIQELDNPEIRYVLRCVSFWTRQHSKIENCTSSYEKGEVMLTAWQSFVTWVAEEDQEYEECIQSFKWYVFTAAFAFYSEAEKEKAISNDPELYRKIGLCLKCLGNYEQARDFLDYAYSLNQSSAPILAELADCQALCGEIRISKVLFREAFFLDPEKIDISMLESEMIRLLISNTELAGYTGAELLEWMPVYGVLFGIFNIKRELHAVELGKLKQACFNLENRLKDAEADQRKLLVPRLINHYFWLIDHYLSNKNDINKKNEILLKIKMLDSDIYTKYNA